ncbi:GumC family protein [Aerosakkonema funiforme]|uniref:Polysaccharide biosynthesis tyrosine autokinase n=1 Tax=Aerosakkonema funiforme FACHB-1375 TaxID=2949571 RepID=A0A926VLW3_9CYAN|nr:polysaccharide biosynthesis tyrosine autokinase [Aerosakkonema funiforme]MBD2186211.1 polysaccharide biosynthesis tyrosine autokinase [Aerosakkonema funiforme FACHB-1375]
MVQVTENHLNAAAETDPGYGQIFAILIRRRFWLIGVFATVLSAAAIITLITKPTYESSMQLLVEANYQGKEQNGEREKTENEYADPNVEIDYATQLNLMRSSQLLGKAVDLLRPEYPDITIKKLKKYLVVAQIQEEKVNTKIFEVTYTDKDAKKTQKVLKTIQKVYQDYNREQQEMRLAKGLAFIDQQLPTVRQNAVQSEAALAQFRKNQNIIEPELQAKALIESLKDIEQELRTVRAQYRDAQARYTALQQQSNSTPQQAVVSSRLSESTRYQTLLNEIQKLDLELAQQRQRFTDANPYIQDLVQQRQELLALLEEEKKRIPGANGDRSNVTVENPLKQGQLGKLDVSLANKLLEEQTNVLGLQAREQTLMQKEQQMRAQINRLPAILADYNRLEPDVKLKRETLVQLQKARQEISLEIARGGFDWQVVEEPELGLQIEPSLKRNILLGAVIGLMLGGVAAFIREVVDDAVHTCDDLKKQVDLPLLGITPELAQAKGSSDAIVSLPFSKPQVLASSMIQVINWPPFRESLDLIYQNIQLMNSGWLKSLVVTSALAGEGKSTLALGLAISAARLHQRVLLIDADLRRPSLHKELNLPNDRGLSSLLASDTPITNQEIEVSAQYGNISILTSGPMRLDPAQMLSSQKMKQLMVTFEQNYDLVLLDAPPVLGIVDTILAASFCSGVVMVGRIGRVTRTELVQATSMLSKLNVIGVVANGASNSNKGYLTNLHQEGLGRRG